MPGANFGDIGGGILGYLSATTDKEPSGEQILQCWGTPMTLVDSFRRLSCSSCQGRGASVLCASCEVRLGMGWPTVTTLLLRIATFARELGHFHHFFVTPRD